MNKLRYRVVFNRARGLCMVVSESARSNGKGANGSMPGALQIRSVELGLPALNKLGRTVLAAFGASAFLIGSATAQIIADPRAPGQQRPTILNAANGVLQINVQTPSGAGVSRNSYVQFDVPASGAILNNSRVDTQAQLGGWVQANPWLTNGGARVILNEVNSSDPSHLRGYIEVAGPRAEVIVANPAGIAVDGGGFINVSRATLTTGTVDIKDSALDGYSVKRGEVSIDGAGLDASHTDYTALIARSVAVNASLWANQLSVTTGVSQVSAAGIATTAPTASGNAPAYGIDVGRLGGMYANKIFLVGTEAGVGVRNAGAIGAAAGDLIVTSEGRLENSGALLSTQQIDLHVRSASNSGAVSGDGGVTLVADTLQNSGQIHSAAHTVLMLQGDADNSHGTIEARRIDLTSASGAILNRQGKIVQSGSAGLDISAASLLNASGGQIGLSAAAAHDNASGSPPSTEQGPLSALPNGQVRAAQTIDNFGGQIAAGGVVSVTVGALDNSGGQIRLPSLNFDGSAFTNRGGTLEVLHDFTAHAPNFDNNGGQLLIGEHFNASLGQFNNTGGLVQAGAWRIAVALGLDNSGGVLRNLGNETASLAVGARLNNENGTLESASSMQLSAGAIAGSGSRLTTWGDLQLDSGATSALGANWNIVGSATIRAGALDFGGIISAGKDLSVTSSALSNRAGLLYGASNVVIRTDGALLNHDGGQIYSGGGLSLSGQRLGNVGGTVKADGPALFSFGAGVDNTAGLLQSAKDMSLNVGGALTNDLGSIEVTGALGNLGVNSLSISNGGGRIVNFGSGATSVSAQSDISSHGLISGNGEMIVSANTLQNDASGVLSSGKGMALQVRRQLDNAGDISSAATLFAQGGATFNNRGNIVAAERAAISAATIDNSGGIATVRGSGGDVVLAAQSLSNTVGAVMADGNAIFDIGGALDNSGGLLQAGKDLRISASELVTRDAVIETLAPTSGLTIQARSISNEAGRIVNVGMGNTDVVSDGMLSNSGLIAGAGNLKVSAQALQNAGEGKIDAGGQLLLKVEQQLGNNGAISSRGALDITGGTLTLTNRGLIASKGNASIAAGQIDNDYGQIVTTKDSAADLVIHAVDVRNVGGSVMSGGKAFIVNTGGLNNDGGTIQSLDDMQLAAGAAISNSGGIIEAVNAAASMTLHAQSIVNDAAGRIVNVGNGPTVLASGSAIANGGLIASNGGLELTADTLNNRAASTISSGAALGLVLRQQLDNAGIISSKGGFTLDEAASTVSNSGAMLAGGAFTLTVAHFANEGGQISTMKNSGAGIALRTGSVNNRGGAILADGSLVIDVAGALENGVGTLQAGKDMQITTGGLLGNNAGVIETVGLTSAMQVRGTAVDSLAGRIVNVGSGDMSLDVQGHLVSSGQIAGNGKLAISAAVLDNRMGGAIVAGTGLAMTVPEQFGNAGAINSGGAFDLHAVSAAVTNGGQIVVDGRASIDAGALNNQGGQIVTVGNSGGDINLHGQSFDNQGGRLLADGNANIVINGAVDNSLGAIQAAKDVHLNAARALGNAGGMIESAGAASSMTVQALSIDNGNGRIVNAGNENTWLTSQSSMLNNGLIAGNGDLTLGAASLFNQSGGVISSGRDLELALSQQLDNQGGTISSAARLHFNQAGASLTNSGVIVSGGNAEITANSINNDGGQLVTVKSLGADIAIRGGIISNRHGVVLADGAATIATDGALDNTGGVVQAGKDMQVTVTGALSNSGGVIEAVGAESRLTVSAQGIANGSGRIVNVGSDDTSVMSHTSVNSSGVIAGNGNLTLDAATLQNGGSIGAGGQLELAVRQQLDNQGQINSGGTLHFDQASANFNNSGQIAAGGHALIAAARIDNHSGQISTGSGSGADITLTGALNNHAGTVLADGMGTYTVTGPLDNTAGVLHAANDLRLTVSGALSNDGGHIEAVGATSTLAVHAQSIDNASGRITNVGNGDTSLTSADGIANQGSIAAGGNLILSGPKLINRLGGSISTGKDLDLLVTEQLDNKGTINSAGSLTFNQAAASLLNSGQIISGAGALIAVDDINNNGGQIGTGKGSGAALTLTSRQLSNQDGRILADGDLTVTAHSMLGHGELFSGRDLALSMDGDYAQAIDAPPIHSNRDLSLTVTGNITNGATFEAVRYLTLAGNRISNHAGAVIQAQGVTLNASGDLDNAGEINGAVALSLSSGGTINNSAGIVGGSVMFATPSLNNSGPTALLGASRDMALFVSNQVNNTGGATVYSAGDLSIAGNTGGAGTSVVNNISSTIEATSNLVLVADTVNNVRENVVLTHVVTLDDTTHMSMPSWYTHGANNSYYDPASANYQPHETYFVSPADILENATYVTPDGYSIGRAVIRTHANDSVFFSAASGAYSAYGHSERIAAGDGTRVLYYTYRNDNVANPDQGGAASNAYPLTETVTNWNSAGPTFSSQYGNCSTDCVRFVTQPDYVDPATTIQRDTLRAVAPVWQKLEVSREAHHVVSEDQLAPGAGAPATILAGGNMHLTVSQSLTNQYGSILASGFLTMDGAAIPTNQGATLYRIHSFDGTWRTEDGTTVAYTMPSLSEVAGRVTGIIDGNQGVSITGRGFSNVDVTAGAFSNIRDSINVIGSGASGPGGVAGSAAGSGAASNATAGAHHGAAIVNHAEIDAGAYGNALTNNAAAADFSGSGAVNSIRVMLDTSRSGASNTASAHRALTSSGGSGGVHAGPVTAINGEYSKGSGNAVEITPGGLFFRNPDANGKYLYETRPEFADHSKWITSDYLLDALSVASTATQKRLGDGFYEQRLVREQLGELTGRAPTSGESDDSVYLQLLASAVSFAKQYGLRPGIALSAEQMGHLTSNIVWMENQLVHLPDGSTQTVLVPKVYLAAGTRGATQPGAAIITGASVEIRADEGIVNRGGVIDAGKGVTALVSNQDIVNQGGSISGGAMLLAAARDVRNESLALTQSYASSQTSGSYTALSNQAVITASGRLQINAGRDLINVAGKVGAGSAGILAARDVNLNTLQTGSTYTSQVAGYTENDSAVTHQLSQLNTAGNLVVSAVRDISVSGAQAVVGGSGALLAGRAVNISAVTNEVNTDQHNNASSKVYDKQIHQNQTVVGAAIGAAGALQFTAGTNEKAELDIIGSSVVANGVVALNASGDVNIRGVQEQQVSDTANHRESSGLLKSSSSSRADFSATSNVVGSSVSGGSVIVKSGNDINISGSDVTAQKELSLVAARDLVVGSAQQASTDQHSSEQKKTGISFNRTDGLNISKAQQQQDSNSQSTTQMASTLSGAAVTALAGRDIAVRGSTVVADADIALVAARDLSIVSAQNSSNSMSASSTKKTGLIGSIGQPAIGTVKSSQDGTASSVTQVGSQVASLAGSVTLKAGEKYTQTASKVIASGGDIAIQGKDVLINAGYDPVANSEHAASSQVAIGGSVSMPVVGAVQGLAHLASAVKDTSNGRMQALAAVTAGMQGPGAFAAAEALADGSTGGIKISVSLGSTKSETRSAQSGSAAVGALVAAGGDINIVASGASHDSNLNVIGSEINAGNKVVLAADNDINLLAAESASSQHSTNSASGVNIGVGFAIGGTQQGVTLELGANKARGKVDGDELIYNNTHVTGNTVGLHSGGDTALKGGVIAAETVTANIGGNLIIQSLQDRSTYDAKQSSAGVNASLCVPPFCYGDSTVSASTGKATVNGNFLSVAEQSGIKAGDGGFQLNVGGKTDLIGGVISSSQAAIDERKNNLTTGSLSYSELQNKDVHDAASYAVNASVSGKLGDQGGATSQAQKNAANADAKPGAAGGVGRDNGSQSAATQSGVSAGVLTITDTAGQAQTGLNADQALTGIGRNVTTGGSTEGVGALAKSWSGDKLMKEVQAQAQITQAFSAQAPKAIATYADNQVKMLLDKADAEGDAAAKKSLQDEAGKWAESGSYRIALHAVSGALGGGGGGALGAGTVAAAAMMLNDLQASTQSALMQQGMSPEAANMVAQGIAEVASLGAGALVGGAAGAATALATDTNNRQLHQSEYDIAKRYKKLVAKNLGISQDEAEGRIVRQLERNVDGNTSQQDGGRRDEQIVSLLGCQLLKCNSNQTDPHYWDAAYNSEYIKSNQNAYNLGALQGTSGLTPQQIVDRNNTAGAPVAKSLAMALGAYVLAPVAGAVAVEAAAFARNPVAYCSINPINCLAAADLVGATAAGVPGTSAPIPHFPPAAGLESVAPELSASARSAGGAGLSTTEVEIANAWAGAGILAERHTVGISSRTGTITNLRAISAEEANAPFIAKGWSPPYDTGSQVRTFTTTTELQFVRVSTGDNPQGAFLVRADEVAGMTPLQIQQHLALPKVPTQIADVIVPVGTNMQVGKVAAQSIFGAANKGGTQYQLLNPIPSNSFGVPRPLK